MNKMLTFVVVAVGLSLSACGSVEKSAPDDNCTFGGGVFDFCQSGE